MSDTLFNVCFLKKFNNYFNRKVIGFDTLADYENEAAEYYIPNSPISFNPADNVSTELIMNDCPFESDYCLIMDLQFNIISRWFVMESVFTRKGQYKHLLRRDVIYDHLDNLLASPVFVQKGWLSNTDPLILNPEGMSFNEIKTDEILLKDDTKSGYIVGYIAKNTSPATISVQTEVVPQHTNFEDIASDLGVTPATLGSILNFNNSESVPSYFAKETEVRFGFSSLFLPTKGLMKARLFFTPSFSEGRGECWQVASWAKTLYVQGSPAKTMAQQFRSDVMPVFIQKIIDNASAIKTAMVSIFGRPYFTQEQLNKLQKYRGKTIKYNGSYYKMEVLVKGDTIQVSGPAIYSGFPAFSTSIDNALNTAPRIYEKHADGEISIRESASEVYVNLNDETIGEDIPAITATIPASRNVNTNNTYDLFVIPFGKVTITSGGSTYMVTSPNSIKRIAAEIAKELDASCYDIQLLPYFPMPDLIINKKIEIGNLTADKDYSLIEEDLTGYKFSRIVLGREFEKTGSFTYHFSTVVKSGNVISLTATISDYVSAGGSHLAGSPSISLVVADGNLTLSLTITTNTEDQNLIDEIAINVYVNCSAGTITSSIMFFPSSDTFTAVINQQLTLKDSVKIESQCNKYRICSPNYQGSFDFNVARNGGSVAYFIAECTYKPYTPYMKVAPQFSYLYGTNYGDARGLICGGDYSLSRFTSAWETFELNNKNYQNIFNREIQNLDFEQSLQMRKELITGGLNVFRDGGIGAASGAMLGGGYGAIAGAAIGLTGSSIGMGIDIDMLVKQQRENRQLAIDKYNYQLGNVKSLPYTLTKVGAFTINSKIFPFLEYYTCTDTEKEALENKLKYESMTVMRIGLFGDFWRIDSELRYFKGELIRNDEIAEDNHVFEAIYTEIAKGVYM